MPGTIVPPQRRRLRLTFPPAKIGSGTVISVGLLAACAFLVGSDQLVGWNATWQSLGVTPLSPHFFDTHVVIDYAACAANGADPYVPHACNPANFNVPPIWLWLGRIGQLGSYTTLLLSSVQIAAAAAIIVILLKGRSTTDGAIALFALLSPSVLMGVERANPDLLILTLVGTAAIVYDAKKGSRPYGALAIAYVATLLKLYPFFTIAVGCRLTRKSFFFAIALGTLSPAYFLAIFHYLLLIRRNVPTTYVLSYGYKAIFLGIDHLRTIAGLSPISLADSWLPALTVGLALLLAAIIASTKLNVGESVCKVSDSQAGTAFLFGSSIYCGTYLLGTNFIYRFVFLLLCLPELLDWRTPTSQPQSRNVAIRRAPLVLILAVLWSNGSSNGHTTFHLMPQIFNWLLFFSFASVLFSHFLTSLKSLSRPDAAGIV